MCIICYVPQERTLSEDAFENCWDNNPDGGGMMWSEDGCIKTYKSLSVDNFKDKYYKKSKENASDIVLHFRIGTHGSNTIRNCHPFKISDRYAFCHNGILD